MIDADYHGGRAQGAMTSNTQAARFRSQMSASRRVTIFRGGKIVLADRVVGGMRLVVSAGRIQRIQRDSTRLPSGAEVVELAGRTLTPGLLDIHVHGGGGADFMDGTLQAARTVCQTHLRHGTTTLFPTTTTGTPAQILAAMEACRVLRHSPRESPAGARIASMHLYGPYFAHDKVGCHKRSHQRPPAAQEYRRYFATGMVGIATCAAELPGAAAFYRAARRRGCLITCGHSNSTFQEMAAAFRAGMRHVDHFWSAMSSVKSLRPRCGTPMQASMEQFVLVEPEMSTEVIADGCHLADELLNFAYRMKGADRLCLVTDSSRALDQPPGKYRFGCRDDGDWFYNDGQVGQTMDRTNLASSVAGMDRVVRTMLRATGGQLADVVRMASLTPAERTGIDGDVGSIAVGKRADLVVWGPTMKVRQVYLDGERVIGSRLPASKAQHRRR